MTAGTLAAYFHNLATTIEPAAKAAAKDMTFAADALRPFADLSVVELGKLLELTWAFKTTGKFPEASPKPEKKVKELKPPARTAAELLALVKSLHGRALQPEVTRESVQSQLAPFEKALKQPELFDIRKTFGRGVKMKNKAAEVADLVQYVMARKGASERADA